MAWTAEQLQNAQTIINVGRRLGASRRDVVIALMAAMQESSLHNYTGGDRDSVGLFQQRSAWGTFQQRHNPVAAATMFFKGGHAGQRGLFDFSARDQMTLSQAAQAVQVSAYPDAYAKWADEAQHILQGHGGGLGDGSNSGGPGGFGGDLLNTIEGIGNSVNNAVQNTVKDPAFQDTLDQQKQHPVADWMKPAVEQTPSVGNGVIGTPENVTSPDFDDSAFTFPVNEDGSLDLSSVGHGKGGGPAAGWRGRARQIAHKYLGTPYVWGGTTPSGFDCSGFVQYVYRQMGIQLPRISYQQANYGKHVALNDLRVGDLVAWDNSSRNNGADHIAIYIGNGRIIEAPRPGLSVQVSELYDQNQAWGVRMHR